MQPSLLTRYTDDILIGATVTATPPPMATYDEDTLLTHRPADRVRWQGSPTDIEIEFTVAGGSPSDARADLLVIPCWNVDGETSPTIARLQSSAGMDVPIIVPAMMPSGIPRTTAIDLSLLETDETKRGGGSYLLTVEGNSVPLIMGGAVMLYGPKRPFLDRDWHVGFDRSAQYFSTVHENEYGTDLVSPRRTRRRAYRLTTICTDAEALDLELTIDANFGDGLPCTLWPIPDVYEAFFGRLEGTSTMKIKVDGADDAVEFSVLFTEISKGKPVA